MLTEEQINEYRFMAKPLSAGIEPLQIQCDYWLPPLLTHIDEQVEQIKSLEYIILELKAELYDEMRAK